MARTKASPVKREASSTWVDHKEEALRERAKNVSKSQVNGSGQSTPHVVKETKGKQSTATSPATALDLVVCVLGIYGSLCVPVWTSMTWGTEADSILASLSWAVLQERITTTPYTSISPASLTPGSTAAESETFTYAIVLNTVQSAFASLAGYVYLVLSTRNSPLGTPSVFPSQSILFPLLLVSITSSLASPFGYASLKHVGYITFILAKSCKLLPVMALNVTIYRTRYPLYKYAVVALVTAGVAVFTVNGHNSKKSKALHADASPTWGLFLLSINLIFDGLTNSTQDFINARWKGFGGAQMMCAQNLIATLLTTVYLLVSPFLASTSLGQMIGMAPPVASVLPKFLGGLSTPSGELAQALAFISRHPPVLYDVLGFAACGAIGQVFIFFTLAKFSSLLLVTITVTRKMLTMVLSVVWFGHKLTPGQWGGVGLVFGGVAAEAGLGRWEKSKKEKAQVQKKER